MGDKGHVDDKGCVEYCTSALAVPWDRNRILLKASWLALGDGA